MASDTLESDDDVTRKVLSFNADLLSKGIDIRLNK